jgi:hypothetical protein
MTDNTGTMGGRVITPNLLNTGLVEDWLSSCWRLHGPDCKPQYSDELRHIRLIDVKDRIVVAHPPQPCEYIALRYVWGNKERKSFRLGSRVETPPQTIEDAMTCTRILGKQYPWVDAVCIDQLDEEDKIQIGSRPSYAQLACNIDGKRLVGLMPTLTQQVWVSPWGRRAWTAECNRDSLCQVGS